MWDPETYVPRQEGYIYANFGRFYVEREGLLARNWQALEPDAQRAVLSRQWSGDISGYYPLTRKLAQKANFSPRPSEHDHYNQLLEQFNVVPLSYDEQERLKV